MAGMPNKTPHGYWVYEAISAMQKCVRRGIERDAMAFAIEVAEAGLFYVAVNRLRIIAQEDIGLGDPGAVSFACNALDHAEKWYKSKNDAWYLGLANAVLALARARKSREADHFQAAVRGQLTAGKGPEIPDFALDGHTQRGRRMGRGLEHFQTVGTELVPPPVERDPYEDEAYEYWRLQEEAGPETSEDEASQTRLLF